MKAVKIFLIFVFISLSVVVSVSNTRKTDAVSYETFSTFPDKSAREIYAQNCARCHGADGRGDTESGREKDVPDIADKGLQQRWSDKRIAAKIAGGGDGMPAFGKKLSAAQIQTLVRYVRALGK